MRTIKFYSFIFALLIGFIFDSSTFAQEKASRATLLRVIEKTIIVNGKKSLAYDIIQPDGTRGYVGTKGQLFNVNVENKTQVPLVLHWHGILDPNDQDGVPYVTQLPIQPGKSYHYQFRLKQAGTYWLHSHYKLQEQKLMAAPLIIHDPSEPLEKEALMFIQDFTFKDPKIVYEQLRNNLQKNAMPRPGMASGMSMTSDVSDVDFDAYLTNQRTLKNPEIKPVMPNESVRLRIINASASSNYYIDLGKLKGSLFAVDGEAIQPVSGSRFQIAIGNRLDIRVRIPKGEGAYPILALPEGIRQQTGLILATPHAKLPTLSEKTQTRNAILDYKQDLALIPMQALPALPVAQSLVYNLQGDMRTYRWTINGQEWPYITPYTVKPNERVELIFNNKSGMSHPMHLHGHVFQVTEINGQKINGRKGDTINVMPRTTVKVVLDTMNPGIWMLHCHILYHQMGGMMTTMNYEGYPNKFTLKERAEGEKLYQISPR